jgi:CCR4-NOT transcription complex subunit 1
MHTAPMEIYQRLLADLTSEARYVLLNAIANQLRYPNNHTHYFSCVIRPPRTPLAPPTHLHPATFTLLPSFLPPPPFPAHLLHASIHTSPPTVPSCVMLHLFSETTDERVQEQITRVLVERLIVHRPHPWGLLITFIELIKNPRHAFWSKGFTRCAPEIERLFESVARSCMHAPGTAGPAGALAAVETEG